MKFEGFIGPAYQLDSSNVDAQRCVNLYPEIIESGRGKAGQVAYLRGTPGLTGLLEVGDGPLRCVHVDSIGRIFVVSGSQLYLVVNRDDWAININPVSYAIKTGDQAFDNTVTETMHCVAHGYPTGMKIRLSTTGALPTPLASSTDYWVISVTADTIAFATSLANALAGTKIDITATGSGTATYTPQIPAAPAAIDLVANVSVANNTITKTAHGLYTGLQVRLGMYGAIPTGLAIGTDYYVIASDVDTIKLASSASNASAGTAVDITAVSSDEWYTGSVGANGQNGGDSAPLSTSTGIVKAASMSFSGEGTDSSTIFVDGVNNYLFKDVEGVTTFAILGEVTAAQVVFNVVDDITLYTFAEAAALNSGGSFTITVTQGGAGSEIYIYLYTAAGDTTAFTCDIIMRASATFSTDDFVQYITYGEVTGKTILFNSQVWGSGTPVTFSQFVASGGGGESMTAAFTTTPGTTESFAGSAKSGADYGSVPTATDIVWSDGYFILIEGGTNRFRVSDLQSFNIDTLSFASSEGSPDIALALKILNRYLYVFNEKTTEVYANTGNADFPFERIQGGFIEIGCSAARSVAKLGSSLFWLGRSEDGDGIIYAMEGTQPRRISTHAIEQAIRGYADPSSASAYTYHSGGHGFYVLNFDEATWVYDMATQLWHERAYTNEGTLERHRAQHCAFIPSQRIHLVSDYATNDVYTMDEDTYSDDGDAITRLRSTPHVSSGRNRLFFSSFLLDMEVGIGLDGGVQGSSPTVMLDWSNDGGHTWSSESWALADAGSGTIGDYLKRVLWSRLGSARQRVFRIQISDPVKIRLIDAQVEMEGGNS